MSAIQSSSGLWVDTAFVFSSRHQGPIRGSGTAVITPFEDTDFDSLSSVISDAEEESEIDEPLDDRHVHSSIHNLLGVQMVDGEVESSASDEIVAAIAAHLQIIEEAEQQPIGDLYPSDESDAEHHSGKNRQSRQNRRPKSPPISNALLIDLMLHPSVAVAATLPVTGRTGLLSLLA